MSASVTQIDSLPKTDENQDTSIWVSDKHDRDAQRKTQRGQLFWCIICVCAVFYGFFIWHMICLEKTFKLLKFSHYSLFLFSLLGLIPTVLLLALMKSVYRSTKEALGTADIPSITGETAKLISSVTQLVGVSKK